MNKGVWGSKPPIASTKVKTIKNALKTRKNLDKKVMLQKPPEREIFALAQVQLYNS